MKLRLQAAEAPSEAPKPPSKAELQRERLMKEAVREPAVQEVLDLFDGKIVDVREAKSRE